MSGTHWKGPLMGSDALFGGAGKNLDIAAAAGMSDMVTTFDDFNGIVAGDAFGAATNWEASGFWVLTDVGTPVSDLVSMNDAAVVANPYDSCIRIYAGTSNDTGGNMQLDAVNGAIATAGGQTFPHMWIPETAAGVAILDNTVLTFACRVGLLTDEAAGTWDAKAFIGLAAAGDTGVLTVADGTMEGGTPIHGFHIPEDGSLDGISQRTGGTAFTEGTNFTELAAADAFDSTIANGVATVGDAIYYDLAMRHVVTNMSDDTANGYTEFFYGRVNPNATGVLGESGAPALSRHMKRHPTVLLNQTPNHTVSMVPTIEVCNGAAESQDMTMLVDFWSFGCSRYSRTSKAS